MLVPAKLAVFALALLQLALSIDSNTARPKTLAARRLKAKRHTPNSFVEFGRRMSGHHHYNSHHHNNNNFYALTAVHRTHNFAPRNVAHAGSAAAASSAAAQFVPIDRTRNERIIIPIGVSHVRPIQYISANQFNHPRAPAAEVATAAAFVSRARNNTLKWQTKDNDNMTRNVFNDEPPQAGSNRTIILDTVVPAGLDEKTSESSIDQVDVAQRRHFQAADSSPSAAAPSPARRIMQTNVISTSRSHPRTIELESSYFPLTIMFPSRPSRLNIVPVDKPGAAPVDLVGQDSTQHKSFNRRTLEASPSTKETAASANSLSKGRRLTLDHRAIFGENRVEEPILLSDKRKSNIPDNMQSIIKCVFPDFKFDGMDKVKSAC